MNDLFDIVELSKYLGMKKSNLYVLIERKQIPYYRIGRLTRFRRSDIDAWLMTKKCEVTQRDRTVRAKRKSGDIISSAIDIVQSAIDELNPECYNRYRKSDRIKGLRKED